MAVRDAAGGTRWIAWAVAEHIYQSIGAKTLFATHYHVLNKMSEQYEGIKNFNIAVREKDGDVIFLRRIVEGGTDRSYGIEVAKLAGLPKAVLDRSREIMGIIGNDNEISLINISDPNSMTFFSFYVFNHSVYSSVIVNNNAFLAGTSNISVLDISEPITPIELSTCGIIGQGTDIIWGDEKLFVLIYLYNTGWSINIIDVSNELELTKIGELNINSNAQYINSNSFTIFDKYILVATQDNGVQILQFEP